MSLSRTVRNERTIVQCTLGIADIVIEEAETNRDYGSLSQKARFTCTE
jgi:hypothetical protein